MGKTQLFSIIIELIIQRMYNLTNELSMNPVRWSLIFTIARGLRLLHDVRLLAKPKQPEQYAKELWITMLTVFIEILHFQV